MFTTLRYYIKGAYFRKPAQGILNALAADTPLILRPEPDNEYDPHAVMVIVNTEDINNASVKEMHNTLASFGFTVEQILSSEYWHLGYIPRDTAPIEVTRADADIPGLLKFDINGKPLVEIEI